MIWGTIEQELDKRGDQKREGFEIVPIESSVQVRQAWTYGENLQHSQWTHRSKQAGLKVRNMVIVQIAKLSQYNTYQGSSLTAAP